MKIRQMTIGIEKITVIKDMLLKQGYIKKFSFDKRIPKGAKEKVNINIRRWCGEWSGFQTFKNEYVFYKM